MSRHSNDAFQVFEGARRHYVNGRFAAAKSSIDEYRRNVDYQSIRREDNRGSRSPSVSIVVVAWNSGPSLEKCIASTFPQDDNDFELIVVDNGGNEGVVDRVRDYGLAYLSPPVNTLPSEGRNIGAYFATGRYIAFVDDDAELTKAYVAQVKAAFSHFDFAAVRGRILPQSTQSNNSFVAHYDLGAFPLPCVLMTEGNMAIRASVFRELSGFDPLVFGGEGTELDHRCRLRFPQMGIYYWPGMVIRHDFAKGGALLQKKVRHEQTRRYLRGRAPNALGLQKRYGRWYAAYPGVDIRVDSRSFASRVFVQVKTIFLGIRSRISAFLARE